MLLRIRMIRCRDGRGALDVRARTINDEIKIAAVHAIRALAKEEVTAEVLTATGEKS